MNASTKRGLACSATAESGDRAQARQEQVLAELGQRAGHRHRELRRVGDRVERVGRPNVFGSTLIVVRAAAGTVSCGSIRCISVCCCCDGTSWGSAGRPPGSPSAPRTYCSCAATACRKLAAMA